MPLPPPVKNPNLPPTVQKPVPKTHLAGPPDPDARYFVHDEALENVWDVNLSYQDAQRLKERIAGRRESRTVTFSLMPTDREALAALRDLGFDIAVETTPGEAEELGEVAIPAQPLPPARVYTDDEVRRSVLSVATVAAAEATARARPVAPPVPPPVTVEALTEVEAALAAADALLASGNTVEIDPIDDIVSDDGAPAGEPTTLTPEQIAAFEREADLLDAMPIEDLLK